jgi:hypothetical protein
MKRPSFSTLQSNVPNVYSWYMNCYVTWITQRTKWHWDKLSPSLPVSTRELPVPQFSTPKPINLPLYSGYGSVAKGITMDSVERSSSWEDDCTRTSLLLLLICTAITVISTGGGYSTAVCSLGHEAKIIPKWDETKIIGVKCEAVTYWTVLDLYAGRPTLRSRPIVRIGDHVSCDWLCM